MLVSSGRGLCGVMIRNQGRNRSRHIPRASQHRRWLLQLLHVFAWLCTVSGRMGCLCAYKVTKRADRSKQEAAIMPLVLLLSDVMCVFPDPDSHFPVGGGRDGILRCSRYPSRRVLSGKGSVLSARALREEGRGTQNVEGDRNHPLQLTHCCPL